MRRDNWVKIDKQLVQEEERRRKLEEGSQSKRQRQEKLDGVGANQRKLLPNSNLGFYHTKVERSLIGELGASGSRMGDDTHRND